MFNATIFLLYRGGQF